MTYVFIVLLKSPCHPRPQTCEYGNKCPKAHSEEELQEWLTRAAEEKEIRHNIEAQGLMSYSERLLEEYRNSSNQVHIVSTIFCVPIFISFIAYISVCLNVVAYFITVLPILQTIHTYCRTFGHQTKTLKSRKITILLFVI